MVVISKGHCNIISFQYEARLYHIKHAASNTREEICQYHRLYIELIVITVLFLFFLFFSYTL